jgi:hypothetical protein
MMKIEQILDKNNFKKRVEKPKISIEEIENKINFKLPEDYKFYLLNYLGNESFLGSEYVILWDLNELVEMNNDYQITDNLTNTIGIGGNGSSEFIAIEFTKNNEYRIVLSPFIDLNKDYHIEIGNSFTDFFKRLENGKDWFE